MDVCAPRELRNLVIYEVFPRSHGPQGLLTEVIADLPRIRTLGVDAVWLMPIYPIGKVHRKGSLGSPYSIVDYRAVHPDLGTLDDVSELCRQAAELDMAVMLDIVFHHTAHDAVLVNMSSKWHRRDSHKQIVTSVPEWWDIIDLDYSDPALWDYLIDTLLFWAERGVGGFRADVASLVPLEFWLRVRRELDERRPGLIWLAESVHTRFVIERRARGLRAHSDAELYRAFDITYDYDIWNIWERAVVDPSPANVRLYTSALQYQRGILPQGAVKLRAVENHDQPRIMTLAPSCEQALAWTAFQAFNEGAFLIYGGQESAAMLTPSLFEREPVDWSDYGLAPFLTWLCALKKDPAITQGRFTVLASAPALTAVWQAEEQGLFGVFNVASSEEEVLTPLPDGEYEDVLRHGTTVRVHAHRMPAPASVAILRFTGRLALEPYIEPSLLL